jgi:hypothetical protein
MSTITLPFEANKRGLASESMLEAALAYARRGWPVIPLHNPTRRGCSCSNAACESPGKHPRTRTGLKEGTTDPEQIRLWWRKWPEANIGVLTGPQSGICVLDVDGDEGLQALTALTMEGGLPQTLRARTGRVNGDGQCHGFHLYFRLPEGVSLRSSAGQLGKGLDLRAAGGYVVAPPSLHASGLRYEWCSPEVEIAGAPEFLRRTRSISAVAKDAGVQIPRGQRNSSLTRLAGGMRRQGASRTTIESALLKENSERCDPPLPEEEVLQIAESACRYPPGQQARREPAPIRWPDLVRLSDVTAKTVDWLWEPYVPLEMITLMSGDPGATKTFLALAMAAALTSGQPLPGGSPTIPSNVLYLTLENSPAHVLRPRFDALGGNPARLVVMRGTLYQDGENEKNGGFSLGDIDQLESAVDKTEARLVVIDPLQSFLGATVDLHRSNETRPILDGIIRVAESRKCAVLIVRHLSKAQAGRALYRGLGSIDISGAARSELFVAADPDDPERRVMAHAKSNLGRLGASIAYTIRENGTLIWRGTTNLTANDLVIVGSEGGGQSAVEEATDFLREALADGPRASKEIWQQAEERGISYATLRRGQARLGIIKRPAGFGKPWLLEFRRVQQQDSPELLNADP